MKVWRTPERQLRALTCILALALSSGFVLSWRLWISSRLFPLSPVTDFLPAIPAPLGALWFATLLALLVTILFVHRPVKLILTFLTLAGLLSLWDQERWQPWFFEYFFMLAAISFYGWKKTKNQKDFAALNACRLIVASTYLWSGLQKLNASFIRETWPDVSRSLASFLPAFAKRLPPSWALLIPLAEIAIASGLVTRRFRNLSVIVAVATHLFVLALLMASGENTVVWPWNIAMALFVVVLFWRDREIRPRALLVPSNAFHALVLLFFAIMPALSFFDVWDSYLSSALYSGNTDQAVIYVTPSVISVLPVAMRAHVWQNSPPVFLDINRWSYGELNVPLYPEPRIYKNVAAQVCRLAEGHAVEVRLRIKKKPNLFTGTRKSEYYDCDHLD